MHKIFVFLLIIFSGLLNAQDFITKVTVNEARIQNTNTQIFRNLEMSIMEFMGSRKWATHDVLPVEAIELNIIITLNSFDLPDNFSATLQIQASRPVYNTTLNTVLLLHEDNEFNFRYVNFQAMDFNINSYLNNLTSVLAFYANIVLGLEADSFSPNGGSTYFDRAYTIMTIAQTGNESGWNPTDGKNNRNRYWLIENMLNDRFKEFREAMFLYHRKGLDMMHKDIEQGRSEVTNAIARLQKVARNVPNSFLMRVFFNGKTTEIINIYSQALAAEKNKVIQMLKEIDPANSARWEKIRG